MSQAPPAARIIVLIGLPMQIRAQLEAEFRERATLRTVPMKRDGGYMLEPPGKVAVTQIEQYADEAEGYEYVAVIVLPYANMPSEVMDLVKTLGDLQAQVSNPQPNTPPWPARPKKMDSTFLAGLRSALSAEIARFAPPPPDLPAEDREVVLDILRGLVTHSKMGPNNHSHEDDLWKGKGLNLPPGGRRRIEQYLLRAELVGRKKNTSMGGTGWVYWIADVAKVRTLFTELEAYFPQRAGG